MRVYLDYSSTTPLDSEILKVMIPYFQENYGNPSSLHHFGQDALFSVDNARTQIARAINAQPSEIFFTSGATESNNLAIQGIIKSRRREYFNNLPHIVISNIEHPSVLNVVKHLIEQKLCEVTFLPANQNGFVDANNVSQVLKENTVLVSVMFANNEIGTLQPVKDIGNIISQNNIGRKKNEQIFFHTDATQAFLYCGIDVNECECDFLSLSGHKIYGPKGIGVLYAREGTKFDPLFFGGGQQREIRPGTLPVHLIVGMGKACELYAQNRTERNFFIGELRDFFLEELQKIFPESRLNGGKENRSPNNINISFPWGSGESFLIALDLEGIAISTGSACSTGSVEFSHVLKALNLPKQFLNNTLRITLGKNTTREEIDYALYFFKKIGEKMKNN